MASFKKYRVDGEPALISQNGTQTPYIPKEIVGHRDAYAASLHLVLKHTADFHILMIECISEKFNIPADEIIQSIHDDERFNMALVDPMIHTMGYFDSEILDMKLKKAVSAAAAEETPNEVSAPPKEVSAPPKGESAKKKIIRKKALEPPKEVPKEVQEAPKEVSEPPKEAAAAPVPAKKKIMKKKTETTSAPC